MGGLRPPPDQRCDQLGPMRHQHVGLKGNNRPQSRNRGSAEKPTPPASSRQQWALLRAPDLSGNREGQS